MNIGEYNKTNMFVLEVIETHYRNKLLENQEANTNKS